MPTYTRSITVRAPLEEVWAFHTDVAMLERASPAVLGLEVQRVTGPTVAADETLEVGTRIEVTVRPFGVGLAQRWTTVVDDLLVSEDIRAFRDVMVEGPLPRWEHTHRFIATPTGTTIVDHVAFEFPGGHAGRLAARLGWLGLAPLFRARQRRTKAILEGK